MKENMLKRINELRISEQQFEQQAIVQERVLQNLRERLAAVRGGIIELQQLLQKEKGEDAGQHGKGNSKGAKKD